MWINYCEIKVTLISIFLEVAETIKKWFSSFFHYQIQSNVASSINNGALFSWNFWKEQTVKIWMLSSALYSKSKVRGSDQLVNLTFFAKILFSLLMISNKEKIWMWYIKNCFSALLENKSLTKEIAFLKYYLDNIGKLVVDNALCEEIAEIVVTGFQSLFN